MHPRNAAIRQLQAQEAAAEAAKQTQAKAAELATKVDALNAQVEKLHAGFEVLAGKLAASLDRIDALARALASKPEAAQTKGK